MNCLECDRYAVRIFVINWILFAVIMYLYYKLLPHLLLLGPV